MDANDNLISQDGRVWRWIPGTGLGTGIDSLGRYVLVESASKD